MSHDPQLMMAVITGSAALVGLTGVVIGQIAQSVVSARWKKAATFVLAVTFLLGISAIIYAVDWLISPDCLKRAAAKSLFLVQVVGFSLTAFVFWVKAEWRQKS